MTASNISLTPIVALEKWFKDQCNDDWEHSYGVSIESIDNPGWLVEIDLSETEWSDIEIEFSRVERSDTNWIQFTVSKSRFVGSGGVGNLEELLSRFFDVVHP